jgi:hypothetical protein
MLKDDGPREKASDRAKRRWRNHDVATRFKAELKAARVLIDLGAQPEPEIADIIKNEGKRGGRVTRFESRIKTEIGKMLHEFVDRNLTMYKAALDHQKRILLREKLRRLETAEAIALEQRMSALWGIQNQGETK